MVPWSALALVGLTAVALAASCAAGAGPAGSSGDDGGVGSGSSSGSLVGDGAAGEDVTTEDAAGVDAPPTPDPTTCEGAAAQASYIGCDYWPTVTANNVWSIFDYAVVVANAGMQTANITVTGPGNTHQTATVDPSSLVKIFLPWVPALKGLDTDTCGTVVPLSASVVAPGGAYHLVSSVPVTVYQFSALEYASTGGPPGKDWSACPGSQPCATNAGQPLGCYSFTNDASLLIPTTAMTGHYRVGGHQGWTVGGSGSYVAITATADGTTVDVTVSSTGTILAGQGVAATAAGQKLSLTMNAGDVAELVGDTVDTSDLSGSLVTASQPVQVITGHPCIYVPDEAAACDHLEAVNFPAETLGSDYLVTQPTGPLGEAVGHLVRIYGNFDGTVLSYSWQPAGCPSTIDAGQVVECGIVSQDFEVKGTHSFGVGTFQQGGLVVDPSTGQGDPSQSFMVAVPQWRTRYVFLAPDDYAVSYVVIAMPVGTVVTLDGAQATQADVPVDDTGLAVLRLQLGAGQAGAHVLTATRPVGIQVIGYGSFTSYQYPGGLDSAHISPPPLTQ